MGESHYLDAEPGEFIVAARRTKGGDDWYVGGVTNDEGTRRHRVDVVPEAGVSLIGLHSMPILPMLTATATRAPTKSARRL